MVTPRKTSQGGSSQAGPKRKKPTTAQHGKAATSRKTSKPRTNPKTAAKTSSRNAATKTAKKTQSKTQSGAKKPRSEQRGAKKSPAQSSQLGRVVLSGGSAGGKTSGYRSSITIDDNARPHKTKAPGAKSAQMPQRHRNRAPVVMLVVVIVAVALGILIDGALTQNRIYAGVKLGVLDLGGKTEAEAAALITETYGPALAEARLIVFPSEELAQSYETDGILSVKARDDQWDALASDAQEGLLWVVDAQTLDCTLPAETLAGEAYAVGRETGGFFTRLGAMTAGYDLSPYVTLGPAAFDGLIDAINASTGDPLLENTVEVVDGQANVIAGKDGFNVDRAALEQAINQAIFQSQTVGVGIVAAPVYGAVQTTVEQATTLAERLNSALEHALVFTCNGKEIAPTREEVGSWVHVSTEPAANPETESALLKATLDGESADAYLAAQIHPLIKGDYTFTMEKTDTDILVKPSEGAPLPTIETAIKTLNDGLFNLDSSDAEPTEEEQTYPETVTVPIELALAPTTMTFDAAREAGLVAAIESYTTEYRSTNTNRVINIHLACDYITDTIVEAGGTWSFLASLGNPTEERGFVGAGAIMANEHQDAIGGGVCQVATTVFNAVYEAGLPITQRANHSLYLSNYPDGRDAAVAYPNLDLTWKNDTDAAILLRADYTASSVTITLYGKDPGYTVTTEVGEWVPGKPYGKTTKVDTALAPGQSYIETYGEDGRSISVTRTVTDESGEPVSEKTFYSTYEPLDEVTVVGE